MPIDKLFSLKGKIAVVTGGTGYLGSAICESLAQAGAGVVVASRNKSKCIKKAQELSKKYKVRTMGLEMDIASSSSVNKSMDAIIKKMKNIDILVNNAVFGASSSLENMAECQWQKGIDGTVNGVFRCTKAVIPYMTRQKKGAIVNISSMYGMVSPDPGIYPNSSLSNPPNYGAGKAAIIQFTKYTACHLASKNIRANCLTPGAFPNKKVQKDKKFISNLNKKIPLGRIGKPHELKGAVLFLASDASSYMTGANIVIDGGWTAW